MKIKRKKNMRIITDIFDSRHTVTHSQKKVGTLLVNNLTTYDGDPFGQVASRFFASKIFCIPATFELNQMHV